MQKRVGRKDWEMEAGSLLASYHRDMRWPRLSAAGFVVWSALLAARFEDLPVAMVSRRDLMKQTGLGSKNTVKRALTELMAKGYLERLGPLAYDRRVVAYGLFACPVPAVRMGRSEEEEEQRFVEEALARFAGMEDDIAELERRIDRKLSPFTRHFAQGKPKGPGPEKAREEAGAGAKPDRKLPQAGAKPAPDRGGD